MNTTLYAIMANDGTLLTIKNRTLHATRKDARQYRKLVTRKDVRIVKGTFTNSTVWTTAK
jgi:hypothetical protein